MSTGHREREERTYGEQGVAKHDNNSVTREHAHKGNMRGFDVRAAVDRGHQRI